MLQKNEYILKLKSNNSKNDYNSKKKNIFFFIENKLKFLKNKGLLKTFNIKFKDERINKKYFITVNKSPHIHNKSKDSFAKIEYLTNIYINFDSKYKIYIFLELQSINHKISPDIVIKWKEISK